MSWVVEGSLRVSFSSAVEESSKGRVLRTVEVNSGDTYSAIALEVEISGSFGDVVGSGLGELLPIGCEIVEPTGEDARGDAGGAGGARGVDDEESVGVTREGAEGACKGSTACPMLLLLSGSLVWLISAASVDLVLNMDPADSADSEDSSDWGNIPLGASF